MLVLGLMQWLTGTVWLADGPLYDQMRDVDGVAITVGATVKLVGTVSAINGTNTHYQDVTIYLLHPNGIGPVAGVVLHAAPKQLVVGS